LIILENKFILFNTKKKKNILNTFDGADVKGVGVNEFGIIPYEL